jgi:hypothetical protein
MKISQIVENASTTSGSIAPTDHAFVKMQTRNPSVYGSKKVGSLFKGKKTSKPFANSISEGKQVDEAELSEDDIILVPGQGRSLRTGFIKHDPDRMEHEGQTLKNSLHTIIRVASELDKQLSVKNEFPEWVSEKIGTVKGMMVSVADYLISAKEMQHDSDAMEGVGGYMASDELMKMSSTADGRSQQDIPPAGSITNGAQGESSSGYGPLADAIKQYIIKHYNGRRGLDTDDFLKVANMVRHGEIRRAREYARTLDTDPRDKLLAMLGQQIGEGAKVDKLVKDITKSEVKAGHSKKEAENIAWATLNKRGMLDNKNKKK